MLELNISFIFHLFFIALGSQIIMFFFNTLYDNVIEFKNNESKDHLQFENDNNALQEKILVLKNQYSNNLKNVNSMIILDIKKEDLENSYYCNQAQNDLYTVATISENKKESIKNYFFEICKII